MKTFFEKRRYPQPPPPPPPSFRPYLKNNSALSSQGGYYLAPNYAKIYNYPAPPKTHLVFGVISLGGSLYGMYNPSTCVLTAGDVQTYWQLCNIVPANQPRVLIVPLPGVSSNPSPTSDTLGTQENTMDVSMIGACCPGSNVTIVLYVAPNTVAGFQAAFSAAIKGMTTTRGVRIPKSNIISCSWGNSESGFTTTQLNNMNNVFQTASAAGIPICAASGDNGASNGGSGLNVDFPASSPFVIGCGGTRLTSPNLTYDASTTEVGWSYNPSTGLGGGGGYSKVFPMPAWQTALKATHPVLKATTRRAVPDIAMNADPNTGVQFLVGCTAGVYAGTSVVAPAMAALIGCMNKPGVSCAKLYAALSKPSTYRDIKSGNNGGFASVVGYDCVVGLGVPNGVALAAAL